MYLGDYVTLEAGTRTSDVVRVPRTYMAAYVEGLADHQTVTVTYRPTGDFTCAGKKKTCTVKVKADADGKGRTPGLMVTGKKGKIVASAASGISPATQIREWVKSTLKKR